MYLLLGFKHLTTIYLYIYTLKKTEVKKNSIYYEIIIRTDQLFIRGEVSMQQTGLLAVYLYACIYLSKRFAGQRLSPGAFIKLRACLAAKGISSIPF